MKNKILSALVFSSFLAGNCFAQEAKTQFILNLDEKLEKQFKDNYGIREKAIIENILTDEIEKVFNGKDYKIELNLINVVPNRPTLQQMSDKMGLSYESFGTGGAKISGKVFDKDGKLIATTNYDYTNPSIYDARNVWTWHDAEWALERFVNKLSLAAK